MRRIYLDHNATTAAEPAAIEVMARLEHSFPGNPESGHASGRAARAHLEDARDAVAACLGAAPAEVLFTSGGTESDNLAVRGAMRAAGPGRSHLVVPATEHPAVLETARALEAEGASVTVLDVDASGRVSVDAFAMALRPDTALASVMTANHETGTLQPIPELSQIARERGVLFHSDAVQALGKIPIDTGALGVDLLSASGHKLGAPKGVGVLWRRGGTRLLPVLTGGKQEGGLRAGTQAVPLCAAFARALGIADGDLGPRRSRWTTLSVRLLHRLEAAIDGVRLNGCRQERLPNTLNLSFDGVSGRVLTIALDQAGIEVSTGSACASGAALPSPVLEAMGLPSERVEGSIRLSMGRDTSEEDVDAVLERLPRLVEDLRR